VCQYCTALGSFLAAGATAGAGALVTYLLSFLGAWRMRVHLRKLMTAVSEERAEALFWSSAVAIFFFAWVVMAYVEHLQ
jgi:hypothetical protein